MAGDHRDIADMNATVGLGRCIFRPNPSVIECNIMPQRRHTDGQCFHGNFDATIPGGNGFVTNHCNSQFQYYPFSARRQNKLCAGTECAAHTEKTAFLKKRLFPMKHYSGFYYFCKGLSRRDSPPVKKRATRISRVAVKSLLRSFRYRPHCDGNDHLSLSEKYTMVLLDISSFRPGTLE